MKDFKFFSDNNHLSYENLPEQWVQTSLFDDTFMYSGSTVMHSFYWHTNTEVQYVTQ